MSDIDSEMDEIRRQRGKPASERETETSARGSDVLDEMDEIRKRKATLAKMREEAKVKEADAVTEDAPAEEVIYVVKKGDNLSKIAKEVYGNAGRWKEIYKANKDQIKDPNLIRPGWKLRIP